MRPALFVHDVHAVMGEREFDFEDTVREEYAPAIARDGARLLWYLHATHGAGEAYMIVTITALADGAAWERLNERLRYGDLADWRARVDAMRYSSTSSLLVQAPWSPLGDLDLDDVAFDLSGERNEVVLREDTLLGTGVAVAVGSGDDGDGVLRCAAAFTSAFDAADSLQVLYRLAPRDVWTPAFGSDSGWGDWSGSLTPTLPDGVQSSTRMLRTTSWSPLA